MCIDTVSLPNVSQYSTQYICISNDNTHIMYTKLPAVTSHFLTPQVAKAPSDIIPISIHSKIP